MGQSLLSTKLNVPEQTTKVLKRSIAIEKLQRADTINLVLVSAPAGYGKSVLVSEYTLNQKCPFVWCNLEAGDQDLGNFFFYLSEGIKTLNPMLGNELHTLTKAQGSMTLDAFIKAYITKLRSMEGWLLILEDYHLVENDALNEVLMMFMTYLTRSLTLILITREDPRINLSKMRLSGKVLEIRQEDLKFSLDETRIFFELNLLEKIDQSHLLSLYERTEGWPAGLQLANLGLKAASSPERFIRGFTSSHRFVMDYLMEEVLESLSEPMVRFLLTMSLVDVFSLDLCQVLLPNDPKDNYELLLEVRRRNMFLVPLDEGAYWYRFHHLFKDMLRKRYDHYLESFNLPQPARILEKAGDWYGDLGDEVKAVRYYLEAKAYPKAAEKVERMWSLMDIELKAASWLQLADALPKDLIRKRPVLAMAYGWALIDVGRPEESFEWFAWAESLYKELEAGNRAIEADISDWKEYKLLPVNIASAKGFVSASKGDIVGLIRYGEEALSKTPRDAYHKRSVVSMLLAFAHWSVGDFRQTEGAIKNAIYEIAKEVNDLTYNSFYMVLGNLYIQMGYLNKAKEILETTLERIAFKQPVPILRASICLLLARISFAKDQLEEAKLYLKEAESRSHDGVIMDFWYKYYLLLSMIYARQGLDVLAEEALAESFSVYYPNPIVEDRTPDTIKMWIEVKDRRPSSIMETLFDPDNYLTIHQQFMKAYYCIVESIDQAGELDATRKALEGIVDKSLKQERISHVIEGQVLLGLLDYYSGHEKRGEILLNCAYERAEEEAFFLPFVLYLPSMLYDKYCPRGEKELLGLREKANTSLAEPLTLRELEVLDLIVNGLSNQEICDTLFLALSTVKGYIQNIYGKLEVKRRGEAIKRAKDLRLIQ